MKKIDLGKDKISKLLLTFSVPCIISMVVNALYNIVDQLFIGNGVGYLGNGATNIVFPITVLCMAFSLMVGDGTSSYLSLKLGEGNKDEAKKGVCNGILVSVIISIIFTSIILIFLPTLLNLFGCTNEIRPFALDYGYVIAIGLPFAMIGTSLNSIIRADGSPKYSSISMISGAILNVILDPVAIYLLDMGVKGAALATIISQTLSFVINILYLRKFKNFKINKNDFKLSLKKVKTILSLGVSSFITQITIVIIITVQNNLFTHYGLTSKFGQNIPLTVLGIVMKINQVLNSIVIGVSVGSQPIVGYNYGAKEYKRVKQTLKYVLVTCLVISLIAFSLFQTIPDKLISLFGKGDELYIEFACLTFRIFLMFIMFSSIQISCGIFFQSIGKPIKSAILSLSRQILFFIPAAFILCSKYGVMGVLYAGPVSDALSFILALIFMIIEIKDLNKQSITKEDTIVDTNNHKGNYVITISREYGSGGRYVGKLLAEKLDLKLYDKDLITLSAKNSGLSASYIEEKEQTLKLFNNRYYNNLTNDDNIFIAESEAIKEVAKKGSCVIIGRCADYVLRDNKNVFKIFLYSDMASKESRAIKYYGLNKNNAVKQINKINKQRENHYNYYTNREWKDFNNYDLIVNVDILGVEKTAELIKNAVQSK